MFSSNPLIGIPSNPPPKFNLDMSFNRHPIGTFSSDPDPFSLEPAHTLPIPTPTFDHDDEPSEDELVEALARWKFSIRTDHARGLIWGPFKDLPDDDDHLDAPKPSSVPTLTQASPLTPSKPTSPIRRQRIFPILRSPILIHIKPKRPSSTRATSSTTTPNLKRSRQSSSGSTCIYDSKPTQPPALPRSSRLRQPSATKVPSRKKAKFVKIAVVLPVQSVNPKSRIRLCTTSQLKYGN